MPILANKGVLAAFSANIGDSGDSFGQYVANVGVFLAAKETTELKRQLNQ